MPGPKAPQEARREQIITAAYTVALRDGVDGVTLRAVAAEAKLSHGLVIFHFKQKEQLVAALLDRVLMMTMREPPSAVMALVSPADRIATLLQHEMGELFDDPRRMRLFFEYWALGARNRRMRGRISAALRRYRATFRSLMEGAVVAESQSDAIADALSAVAVSFVSGFAMQAIVDDEQFDADGYKRAVAAIVQRIVPSPARRVRAAARVRTQ